MQRQKKILYLITKANFGGAQRYVYDLATNIDKKYNISVAYGEIGLLEDKLQNAGIKTIRVKNLTNDMNILRSVLATWEIFLLLIHERPNVFHINSSKAGVFGSFAARIALVPNIIFTIHGLPFNEDRAWWQKAILKFALWLTIIFSHKVISVSNGIESQIHHWPFVKNKIHIIHNGVTTNQEMLTKEQARKELNIDKDMLVIGTIAELHPIKGIKYTIDAIAKLQQNYPNLVYVVLGEGLERKELEKQISQLNLENYVFLYGYIDNARRLLNAFDIFILNSNSEGHCYVIQEAGLASLPVIATNVGGNPEVIINKQNGILIPPANADETKKAIEYMLQNKKKRSEYGKSLKNLICASFTFDKMLQKTTTLY